MKFLSVLSLISDLCVLSVPCPAYDQHGEPDDHGHNSHDDHLNHLHHLNQIHHPDHKDHLEDDVTHSVTQFVPYVGIELLGQLKIEQNVT